MGKGKKNRGSQKRTKKGGQVVRVVRVAKNPPPTAEFVTDSSSPDHPDIVRESDKLFDGPTTTLANKENQPPSQKPITSHIKKDEQVFQDLTTSSLSACRPAPSIRPKGLTNLGNTCYFNSTLQVLGQTTILRILLERVLINDCEWTAIHSDNFTGVKKTEDRKEDVSLSNSGCGSSSSDHEDLSLVLPPPFELPSVFLQTLKDLRNTGAGSQVFSPGRLLNSLGKKSWQFRGRDQQDSHELLRTLLDLVRSDEVRRHRKAILNALGVNDINNVDDDTKAQIKSFGPICNFTTIDSVFGGYTLSSLKCEECGHVSQLLEPFYDLSLPISDSHHHKGHQPLKSNKGHQQTPKGKKPWKVGEERPSTSNEAAIPLPPPSSSKITVELDTPPPSPVDNPVDHKTVDPKHDLKNRKKLRQEKKAARRAEKLKRKQQAAIAPKEDPDESDDPHDQTRDKEDGKNEVNGGDQGIEMESPQLSDFEVPGLLDDWEPVDRTNDSKECSLDSKETSQLKPRDQSSSVAASLKLNMSYQNAKTSADKPELNVNLEIQTNQDVNVNLAIKHSSPAGINKKSFECNLATPSAVADSSEENPSKSSAICHPTGDHVETCRAEPTSLVEADSTKCSTISSDCDDTDVTGSRNTAIEEAAADADEEDDGIEDDRLSVASRNSSTRAVCDDEDLDVQLQSLRLTDDDGSFNNSQNISSREDLSDVGSLPDVDDYSSLLPPDRESPTDAKIDPSPEDLPPEPSKSTSDFLRRMRTTSESAFLLKERINWSLTTVSRVDQDGHHDNELTLEACLSSFTQPELLTGSNKLFCESCTEKKYGPQKPVSSNTSKDKETVDKVFSTASKSMLIAYPPFILTLHLKRFQAVGFRGVKINRQVKFPFLLNISPWTSRVYQSMGLIMGVNEFSDEATLTYRLYGLVEHSGTLNSGHYTAMVRIRRTDDVEKRRLKYLRLKPFVSTSFESFLESVEESAVLASSSSMMKKDTCMPASSCDDQKWSSAKTVADDKEDKWFYVSDSHVSPTTRDSVLNSQAYLLFYERV